MTFNFTLRNVAALVLPLALFSAGAAVFAQSTTSSGKMATFICRQALSNETSNASMTKSSTELVCEPFAVSMRMSDGSLKTIGSTTVKAKPGPDFSGALTPQQFDAAYNKWFLRAFDIDPAEQHSP